MKDEAPAVRHGTGRTPGLAVTLVSVWLMGAALAAATGGGMFGPPVDGWRGWVLLGAVLGVALALLDFWRRQRPRVLVWDGGNWGLIEHQADAPQDEARIQVRLDAQRALLLRFSASPGGRAHWLWAQAGDDRHAWHLLRCALYSSAKSVARVDAAAVTESA